MNFQPLRDYLNQLIERGVPGCELAVCRNHEILFHECAGYSDTARTRPAAPTDRYLMYSGTKPVTATAAMQCIERGLFALEDPVEKYIPEFADAHLLRDGVRMRPETTMTIRHLLTMTAGFDYNLQSESILRMKERTGGCGTTRDLAAALAEQPLCFNPGERFQYSLCHDVLGAVIEAASGQTLRDYMMENLFAPLGMSDTDFWTPGRSFENMAAQYSYDAETDRVLPMGCVNELIPGERVYSGGAGLVSTATDYLKLTDALACGGVLSRESIDRMRREELPAFRTDGTFTCTCGQDYGYGLGVRTRVAFNEGVPSAIGEFGWDGAAGMDLMVDPEHGLSFVYVQHVRNWPPMVGAVHLYIRDLLYPIPGLY